MKRLFLVSFLLVSSVIYAQGIDYTKVPQIQTRATFTKEVQPDIIVLSITLSENDSKGKVSVEELEGKLEGVLKNNQVDINRQLTLKDLSSNFQSYFLKKADVQKIKNYYLELTETKTAGKILRELAENDISNVKLVKKEYSKLEELKIELKGKAVLKARRQAEEMAEALHQRIGTAIFISDMETNVVSFLEGQAAGINIHGVNSVLHRQKKESDLDVSFDNIGVSVTVVVHFRIED